MIQQGVDVDGWTMNTNYEHYLGTVEDIEFFVTDGERVV